MNSHLLVFLLSVESLELLVTVGLLARLLDEVADGVAPQHLLRVEDLVEILFELLPSFLDVLRTVVGDPEDLLLGEGRPASHNAYRLLMLLSSRASWTLRSSL